MASRPRLTSRSTRLMGRRSHQKACRTPVRSSRSPTVARCTTRLGSSTWSRLQMDDLVKGDDVFFSLTGVTDGELVRGVRFFANGARTETLAMRSRSGTIRRIQSEHNFTRLQQYSGVPYGRVASGG